MFGKNKKPKGAYISYSQCNASLTTQINEDKYYEFSRRNQNINRGQFKKVRA